MDLPFELLTVFGVDGDPFSGNPLCVVTEAAHLDDDEMQSWARQFNLSETTFVTHHDGAGEASVRIFTPGHEMPFAGHPTLGTAQVVAELASLATGSDAVPPTVVHLSMPAGRIPVERTDEGWRLTAPAAGTRPVELGAAEIAGALGVDERAVVLPDTAWVDSGVEQLLVRLDSVEAVHACSPDTRLVGSRLAARAGVADVYVWAWSGAGTVEARFFFTQGSSLVEDPATGSAAANLGGWLVSQGARDLTVEVHQGAAVRRRSLVRVEIDGRGIVHVGGRVERVGAGTVTHRPAVAPSRTGNSVGG